MRWAEEQARLSSLGRSAERTEENDAAVNAESKQGDFRRHAERWAEKQERRLQALEAEGGDVRDLPRPWSKWIREPRMESVAVVSAEKTEQQQHKVEEVLEDRVARLEEVVRALAATVGSQVAGVGERLERLEQTVNELRAQAVPVASREEVVVVEGASASDSEAFVAAEEVVLHATKGAAVTVTDSIAKHVARVSAKRTHAFFAVNARREQSGGAPLVAALSTAPVEQEEHVYVPLKRSAVEGRALSEAQGRILYELHGSSRALTRTASFGDPDVTLGPGVGYGGAPAQVVRTNGTFGSPDVSWQVLDDWAAVRAVREPGSEEWLLAEMVPLSKTEDYTRQQWEWRFALREKLVAETKITGTYQQYAKAVLREQCQASDPSTPRVVQQCGKREFARQLKWWRAGVNAAVTRAHLAQSH